MNDSFIDYDDTYTSYDDVDNALYKVLMRTIISVSNYENNSISGIQTINIGPNGVISNTRVIQASTINIKGLLDVSVNEKIRIELKKKIIQYFEENELSSSQINFKELNELIDIKFSITSITKKSNLLKMKTVINVDKNATLSNSLVDQNLKLISTNINELISNIKVLNKNKLIIDNDLTENNVTMTSTKNTIIQFLMIIVTIFIMFFIIKYIYLSL